MKTNYQYVYKYQSSSCTNSSTCRLHSVPSWSLRTSHQCRWVQPCKHSTRHHSRFCIVAPSKVDGFWSAASLWIPGAVRSLRRWRYCQKRSRHRNTSHWRYWALGRGSNRLSPAAYSLLPTKTKDLLQKTFPEITFSKYGSHWYKHHWRCIMIKHWSLSCPQWSVL